jgi:hypothetical protein
MTISIRNATDYFVLNENLTNATDEWKPPSFAYVVSLSILLSLVDIATLVGNLLVVIAVLTTRSLSTVTNYFIMSLAIADMLVAVFVLPISIYMVIYRHNWIFGSIICDLWVSFDMFFCTASILNLCCISLDRYFAITRPLEYSQKRSPKLARSMIAIAWLASLLISLPPIIGWRDPERHKNPEICYLNRLLSYRIYSSMGSFYVPALVMVFVYARIFKVIHDRENGILNTNTNQNMRAQRGGTNTVMDKSRQTDLSYLKLHTKSSFTNSPVSLCSPNLKRTPIRILQKPDTICEVDNELKFDDEAFDNKESDTPLSGNFNGLSTVNSARCQPNKHNILFKCFKQRSSKRLHKNDSQCSNTSSTPSYYEINDKRDSFQLRKKHTTRTNSNKSNTSAKQSAQNQCSSDKNGSLNFTAQQEVANTPSNASKTMPRLSHAKLPNLNNRYQEHKRLLKESKAAKTLGIVVGGFIVCWLPFFVLYILESVCTKCSSAILADILTWLGYFNSVINPFIYDFYSKQFRFAFYRLTLGKCQCIAKILNRNSKQHYDKNSSFHNLRNNIGNLMNSKYH